VSIVEQVEKDEAIRDAFSIGEQIAIALVLDRADWLKELGPHIMSGSATPSMKGAPCPKCLGQLYPHPEMQTVRQGEWTDI
jgi:hypothetical protein